MNVASPCDCYGALERAVEERTPWLPELKMDPLWDNVRSDPRFIAVLKKIGLEK
jgi:hypothetical protein